jgi:hypothetical protein
MNLTIRLGMALTCLSAGIWTYCGHRPPTLYGTEAHPLFLACIASYTAGAILFVCGDLLARAETWALRKAFSSIPDPAKIEVKIVHLFGLLLLVCGVFIPPCL